ncbi:MAG: NAD(P)H-hydrate dehydratase [Phycisphaerales bacterium]|nr:NAD(P)H-hydrate dehydratase [Phycisphaerales bacterium]
MDGGPPPVSLPPRPDDAHKGTFGTVLVVGGRDDAESCMVGGPAFAALGALRVGAGRVLLGVPRTIESACLSVTPSATGAPIPDDPIEAADRLKELIVGVQAMVVGPGLGTGPVAKALVEAALDSSLPVVLDADGLNVIASDPVLLARSSASCVITPHPGEFQRLAEALGLPPRPRDDADRIEAAAALADRLGVITVLKGQGTVVSDGRTNWTCPLGTPALATAGTGDVLAGVIGGLLSQDPGSPRDSAMLGVWIHAAAGERWAARHGDAGLLAAELAEEVPSVLRDLPRRG